MHDKEHKQRQTHPPAADPAAPALEGTPPPAPRRALKMRRAFSVPSSARRNSLATACARMAALRFSLTRQSVPPRIPPRTIYECMHEALTCKRSHGPSVSAQHRKMRERGSMAWGLIRMRPQKGAWPVRAHGSQSCTCHRGILLSAEERAWQSIHAAGGRTCMSSSSLSLGGSSRLIWRSPARFFALGSRWSVGRFDMVCPTELVS
jgi:hypothetical protein